MFQLRAGTSAGAACLVASTTSDMRLTGSPLGDQLERANAPPRLKSLKGKPLGGGVRHLATRDVRASEVSKPS